MYEVFRKYFALAYCVLLASSCGLDQPSVGTSELAKLEYEDALSQAQVYFSTHYNLDPKKLSDITVGLRAPHEVTRICGAEVASCNTWHRIVVREDVNLCEAVAHEMGHSASWHLYRDWDYEHARFPGYYDVYVFESCAGLRNVADGL